MARAPQQGTNGQGKVFKQGEAAKGTTDSYGGGDVQGTIKSFVGGSHQHAVIESGGYTYIVDTRTLKDPE